MALKQKRTVFMFGKQLDFNDAYVQITHVNGDKNTVTIEVTFYDSADKRHIIERKTYQFSPLQDENAHRWDKQGYEHLKATDEFADAIDV